MSRLYDRNFLFAFLGQTMFVLANSALSHYARWITLLGGNELDVGSIMGFGAIASLVIRPWIGPAIDRLGDRTAMVIGLSIYAVSLLLNPMLVNLGPAIYALRCMTMVGSAIFFASSLTYVTRTTAPDRRTEAIGSLGAGGFLGITLGPIIADKLLFSVVGPQREVFARYFYVLCLSTCGTFVVIACLRKGGRRHHPRPLRFLDFFRTVARFFPGEILIVDFAFGVCMAGIFFFLSKFVQAVGIEGIGSFFLIYAGWGLVMRFLSHRIFDDWPSEWVLQIGLICFAAGAVSFNVMSADHPYSFAIPALLCGTGHALMFHHMISLTMARFPAEHHGTGSVLALMLLDFGQFIGARMMGGIWHWFGVQYVYPSVALVCVASSIIVVIFSRQSAGQPKVSP